MTWKTTLSFVVSATLLTLAVGWLIATGAVPIQKTIQFNDAERAFMQVWIRLAIAIGLILPSVAVFIGFKHPQLRKILMSLAIAGLVLGRCKASADDSDREKRNITVTCTSTVAYDIGACQILANARCEGEKAQLRGVLSSTFLPANKLYQNVARYRCLSD
jgi:hypothetical protein